MTLYNILLRSQPFVLGFCKCGCGEEIPIQNKMGYLQKYKHTHNLRIIEYKREYTEPRGYLMVLRPPNYHTKGRSKYIRAHRLIWETHYNCCLLRWIELHHINENPADNRIENLQPMLKPDHTRKHNPIKDHSNTVCLRCKKSTTWSNRKTGKPYWHRYKEGYICGKCYDDLYDGRWTP